MKIFLIFIFLFFSQNINCASLFETDYYEINFISNDVSDEKKNKILEIKFNSIDIIFKNILLISDYNNFKSNLDEDLINTFIKNILIEDEKIINNNYYSKIKINYNKKKIIDYLRLKKLSYTEVIPNKFLTIIYENKKLTKSLFSKNNSHYDFLINNTDNNSFFQIPNLDINDRFILDYSNIESLNIQKIDKFLNKYSQTNALVIIAKEIENYIEYSIYTYSNSNFKKIHYFNTDKYNYDKLFKDLKNIAIDSWKIDNSIDNKTLNNINCDISYYNFLELKQIKMNLSQISMIKKIQLKNIEYKKNNYFIFFYGNRDLLSQLFIINGLQIKFDNNLCTISLI